MRSFYLNSFKMGNGMMLYRVLLVCLASSNVIILPCEAFFFPKSFFRKSPAEESPAPPQQQQPYPVLQQQHPRILGGGGNAQRFPGVLEPLQGSGTDIQPALRIVNRPPPPRNNDQAGEASGPQPGSGFHVPRELCLACERFPWMPMAGGERPPNSGGDLGPAASLSQAQRYISPQPTKTIVINALGEAQGPVPLPPSIPNRRPFAIQFDVGQSGNNVGAGGYQDEGRKPLQGAHQQNQPISGGGRGPTVPPSAPATTGPPQIITEQQKQNRPVSFQIFQAETPKPPTILHQVSQSLGVEATGPYQEYGQPSILHPQNVPAIKQPLGEKPNLQQPPPNNLPPPPPNPHAVGTIVAAQQNGVVVGRLPEFQKIQPAKLVYQEHFTSQGLPSAQNFKIPIINQQAQNIPDMKPPPPPPNSGYIQNNNNVGISPQQPHQGLVLQMRPPAPFNIPLPRPSTNMKPPGPMIHYGKPVHIPNNIGPQRPSGQFMFPPPPQGFLQMGPPPPPQQQQPNLQYGQESNNIRPQDERRPSPSGQILNVHLPNNNLQFPTPNQQQQINQLHPVPIPVPNNNVQNLGPRPFPPQTNELTRPDAQSPAFTQETGWEIIPSIQTDLTHLFHPGKGSAQNPQGNNKELPVPVPLPVPQSNPPKSPLFIVAGTGNQEPNQEIKVQDVSYHEEGRKPVPTTGSSLTSPTGNDIKPETSSNSISESQVRPQQQPEVPEQGNYRVNPNPPQFIRPRPFILGVPSGPPPMRPVVFTQQHLSQFQPSLSPSIMTDLKHAEETSLLTHKYLTQGNNGGVQQHFRENGIFVRPVVTAILNSQLHPHLQQQQQLQQQLQQQNGNFIQEVGAQSSQIHQGVDPRIPQSGGVGDGGAPSQEYATHNCQNVQQQPSTTAVENQIRQEAGAADGNQADLEGNNGQDTINTGEASHSLNSVVEDPQPTSETLQETPPTPPGVRGALNIQDNGNKGSYFLYYPRPVSKSPVYWVQQPSRAVAPGVVRLSPQMTPVSPSVASSLVTWSRPRVVVANQFRTNYRGPEQQQGQQGENAEESHNKQEDHFNQGRLEAISAQSTSDENIPYGEKLGVNRDKSQQGRTPFDIITVSGSDEIQQSLEDDHSHQDSQSSQDQLAKVPEEPDYGLTGNDESTNKYVGEYAGEVATGEQDNSHQNVHSVIDDGNNIGNNNFENDDDSDDEREDFGVRPQTTFRKPISTTVIHSPGASSFQSMKLPNFKPHRVIVHDFTSHSANAAATGPSGSSLGKSQNEAFFSSAASSSSSTKSPSSIWEQQGGRIKAPKYVENDEEEEDSSAESINRPQGLNIQEVIASGPVQTADCLTTTHTGHGHSLLVSSSTLSPRAIHYHGGDVHGFNGLSGSKGREIYLPLGSRFPGGRPSIFSSLSRPSPAITTSSSTTIRPDEDDPSFITTISSSNGNKAFGHHASSSSGGFAASIPVPVYRRPISISNNLQEDFESNPGSDQVTYIKPQTNILVAEDIYKESEVKEETAAKNNNNSPISFLPETSTSSSYSSSSEAETVDPSSADLIIMSTEKSSSFSVSIGEDKKSKLSSSSSSSSSSVSEDGKTIRRKVVQVTSVPVVTDPEPIPTTTTTTVEGITSTTSIPPAASTSTKVVKTVRVRQRMRSGSFNGPLRNRFHGQGRVRVVHRPATQEYIRHFPEFSTQEGDKLAKEEEQEVKNALIELKKSPESIKTH